MAWTRVLLLLALAFAAANAAGDTFCGKKTKKFVTIEQGDKVVFKTQREKAKKYRPNTRCMATYELGSTCSEMKLSCSTSRIGNKDKKKCTRGDKMIVRGEKKSEKFCGRRKPKKTIKRGRMKVVFFSDKKNNAPGSTCFVKCSRKKETELPKCSLSKEETGARDDVLLLVGGDNYGFLNSSEVYGNSSCQVPSLTTPTLDVIAVYFENQVLACGGYAVKGYTGKFENTCYSLGASEWSVHSNMTNPRVISSAVVAGGSLYMLGGHQQETNYEVLSAGSTDWGPSQNIPGKVMGSCAVALDEGFVIIGSASSGYETQVLQFNGSAWSNWANLTEGRSSHACIVYNINIIVAGGAFQGFPLATTVIIDTKKKTSSDGPSLTGARLRFVFANVNGLALAVGGDYDGGPTQTGEEFDPCIGGTLHQNLSTPRNNLVQGAVVPKSVIVSIIGCS